MFKLALLSDDVAATQIYPRKGTSRPSSLMTNPDWQVVWICAGLNQR